MLNDSISTTYKKASDNIHKQDKHGWKETHEGQRYIKLNVNEW